ncbi:GGDEF domain-containing protein [Shewanella sp. JM162201]|uniref:diguanylate cyclase n=1 Tax=Shewanella jiangmenensis TaxID=2837387 RepID=A0ABS5V4P4_9GAMM|nr:GGDEF domain-containing protein [Shewanella jiangmenensis]MBT1444908.1 GGDEF domain-containing protein [Shewanella jiangmenensis]
MPHFRWLKDHPIQFAVVLLSLVMAIFVLNYYEWRTTRQYDELTLEFLMVCFWLFLMFACSLASHLGNIYTLLLVGTSLSFIGSLLDWCDELVLFTSLNTVEDITQSTGLIVAGLGLWRLLKYLHHQQQHLKKLAATDPLTGALNRRSFNRTIDGSRGVFALVDVDHFKSINDSLGHDAGDYVLVELSKLIATQIRTDDQFFRWGGEEFLLEFNGTGVDEAYKRMDSLRALVAQSDFSFNGRSIHLTISAGLADIPREQGGIERAIKAADEALYRAKEAGRNRIEMAA